jgi:hypothetical protein
MPRRPCLDCGTLTEGSRCPEHAKETRRGQERGRPRPAHYTQRYDWAWRQQSKQLRAEFVNYWGDRGLPPQCPGWGTPPHPTTQDQLVVDHDLGVCCRSCNSRKAQLWDKPRTQGGTQTT